MSVPLGPHPFLDAFVGIEAIEPTNNDAERVLRHAVLWRKSSGGTDSEAGSRLIGEFSPGTSPLSGPDRRKLPQ